MWWYLGLESIPISQKIVLEQIFRVCKKFGDFDF
jgi:hypothetical protein